MKWLTNDSDDQTNEWTQRWLTELVCNWMQVRTRTRKCTTARKTWRWSQHRRHRRQRRRCPAISRVRCWTPTRWSVNWWIGSVSPTCSSTATPTGRPSKNRCPRTASWASAASWAAWPRSATVWAPAIWTASIRRCVCAMIWSPKACWWAAVTMATSSSITTTTTTTTPPYRRRWAVRRCRRCRPSIWVTSPCPRPKGHFHFNSTWIDY